MGRADFARKYGSRMANAEIQLAIELNRRGIYNFITQYQFLFIHQVDGVHGTIIDLYFPKHSFAVYLDGDEVHKKLIHERRDLLINQALRRRGIRVRRFTYHAPITKKRLMEIADEIEEELEGR